MLIAIAADHGGYKLKDILKKKLIADGNVVADFGADSEISTDYPDYAHRVCDALVDLTFDYGILICGSGIGMAMTANKHYHIRAAVLHNREVAALTRQHNNANVACLGARLISPELAIEIIDTFLSTPYEGGRHDARLEKMIPSVLCDVDALRESIKELQNHADNMLKRFI